MPHSKLKNVTAGNFTPAYLKLSQGALSARIKEAGEVLKKCSLCPRNCGVDRTIGELGFCRTGAMPFISSYGAHFGEEKPLVGRFGSGTIFMGHCNLGCIFCQNYTISHRDEGSEISFERLARIMLSLQNEGCHNINFVTPTHQVPMILRALEIAIQNGIRLPLVYNCGGYESFHSLSILDGIVDIYMPDFKYADPEMARQYSAAEDYPEIAKKTIKEMHRQTGDLILDARGVAVRGLLVRHLVMPEGIAGTGEIVRFISEEISRNTYVNIMDQYRPCYKAYEHPALNRRITAREYTEAVNAAVKAGLARIDGITA